jgi:hypothetical protein
VGIVKVKKTGSESGPKRIAPELPQLIEWLLLSVLTLPSFAV